MRRGDTIGRWCRRYFRIDSLLRTGLEYGGADRAILLLPRDGELRVHAEATVVGDGPVTVTFRDAPPSGADVQGTGLGLAISRRIVEAQRGRLWATANAERGATFYFAVAGVD